jgi:hypothetical protein
MARIRSIKPDFWGSPKTARVSRDARLLFIGLLNESDDYGRLLGSPRRLAGAIFPHDEDVDNDAINRWLDELESVRLVQKYVADGIEYVFVIGFMEHQKVSHPTDSRLPEPPLPGTTRRRAPRKAPETFRNDSGEPPESFGPDLGTGNREQGTGNRDASSAEPSRSLVVVPHPSDPVQVVFDAWRDATGHDRALLDEGRRKLIQSRLKQFPVEDLVDAVRGWRFSPYHCGENATRTVYDGLKLLLRDAEQIEKFRDLERAGPQRTTARPKGYDGIEAGMAAFREMTGELA